MKFHSAATDEGAHVHRYQSLFQLRTWYNLLVCDVRDILKEVEETQSQITAVLKWSPTRCTVSELENHPQ